MMDYSNFKSFPFPEINDIIYVIGVLNETEFHEFYVGRSSRNIGRFGDYISSKFSASTDFKVGQAIQHLINRGFKVEFKYRNTLDPNSDEKELIMALNPILNKIKGYNYNDTDDKAERSKIACIMDEWIKTKIT